MVSDLIKNVMFFVLFASLDIHWDGMKKYRPVSDILWLSGPWSAAGCVSAADPP
jgi:hypothetical protein